MDGDVEVWEHLSTHFSSINIFIWNIQLSRKRKALVCLNYFYHHPESCCKNSACPFKTLKNRLHYAQQVDFLEMIKWKKSLIILEMEGLTDDWLTDQIFYFLLNCLASGQPRPYLSLKKKADHDIFITWLKEWQLWQIPAWHGKL